MLMCLVYDRKLTFCHFVLLQTLKTRALSRANKGIYFPIIASDIQFRRDRRNSSPVCVNAEPPDRVSVHRYLLSPQD